MKLARVTGTVTATAKDAALVGGALLLTDVIDGKGKMIEPALVALDTVGAGVGDTVLIVTGSGARMPARAATMPVDAAIVAVIDQVTLSKTS